MPSVKDKDTNEIVIVPWHRGIRTWFRLNLWPEVDALIKQNDLDVANGGTVLTVREIMDLYEARFDKLYGSFYFWFISPAIARYDLDEWRVVCVGLINMSTTYAINYRPSERR